MNLHKLGCIAMGLTLVALASCRQSSGVSAASNGTSSASNANPTFGLAGATSVITSQALIKSTTLNGVYLQGIRASGAYPNDSWTASSMAVMQNNQSIGQILVVTAASFRLGGSDSHPVGMNSELITMYELAVHAMMFKLPVSITMDAYGRLISIVYSPTVAVADPATLAPLKGASLSGVYLGALSLKIFPDNNNGDSFPATQISVIQGSQTTGRVQILNHAVVHSDNVPNWTNWELQSLQQVAMSAVAMHAPVSITTDSNGTITSIELLTADIPPAPINISVNQVGANAATVSWDTAGGTASNYLVAMKPASTVSTSCAGGQNVGISKSFVMSGLAPNTSYSVAICQVSAAGITSSAIGTVFNTTSAVPSPTPTPAPTPTGTPTSSYTNIVGTWISASNQVIGITQNGLNVAYTVDGSNSATGTVDSAYTKTTGWGYIGTISSGLTVISWSNGSLLKRVDPNAAYPNLAGNWLDNSGNKIVISQSGTGLTYSVNGSTVTGSFANVTTIVGWDSAATLGINNTQAVWKNGVIWNKK